LSDSTDLMPSQRTVAPAAVPSPSTGENGESGQPAARRRRGTGNGLAALVLPELQSMATGLGITGTARMRKSQLIEAITARQGGNGAPSVSAPAPATSTNGGAPRTGRRRAAAGPVASQPESSASPPTSPQPERTTAEQPTAEMPTQTRDPVQSTPTSADSPDRPDRAERPNRQERWERNRDRQQSQQGGGDRQTQQTGDRQQAQQGGGDRQTQQTGDRQQAQQGGGDRQSQQTGDRQQTQQGGGDRQSQQTGPGGRDDDFDGRNSRRRGRFRDRNRNRNNRPDRFGGGEAEPTVGEDDVVLPVAGIVDILDNYAFVRTSGYLSGPNDVYVSLAQVRRYGLRKGDAVTGAVKAPRDGERREKFNALVRMDTVNGMDPEQARNRVEFNKMTPLYPQDRLRLENDATALTPRIIDLVAPIGKGQRGLIVSPPKAGKTMVLQAIANAITVNNPECHLMVVLVDERPEEVTDMQRSVKGEVIASTFDRPAEDHTTVAELSIERAKRLVEMGHDVVVLLDSITRLGRAYNLAAPASGRILSGGVDSTALYPPKRFFGAARNIENGGSLTILATALVETGSRMDEVIFEEFKGTGNMELKLDRKLADKRIFPAVDVDASGTRKEELLMSAEELAITWKLRRVLHALEMGQALELLLDKMKATRSNIEFLMQIQKTTVGPGE